MQNLNEGVSPHSEELLSSAFSETRSQVKVNSILRSYSCYIKVRLLDSVSEKDLVTCSFKHSYCASAPPLIR